MDKRRQSEFKNPKTRPISRNIVVQEEFRKRIYLRKKLTHLRKRKKKLYSGMTMKSHLTSMSLKRNQMPVFISENRRCKLPNKTSGIPMMMLITV